MRRMRVESSLQGKGRCGIQRTGCDRARGGHGCRGRSQHCPSPCRKGPSAQVRIGAGSPAGAVAGDRRRALVDLGVTTGATWSRGHGPSRPGAVGRAGRIEYTEQPLKRRSRDVTGTGDVARNSVPAVSVRDQSGEVVGSAASLPMPTASWSRLTPSRRSCVIVGVLLRTPCSPRWMWVSSWGRGHACRRARGGRGCGGGRGHGTERTHRFLAHLRVIALPRRRPL